MPIVPLFLPSHLKRALPTYMTALWNWRRGSEESRRWKVFINKPQTRQKVLMLLFVLFLSHHPLVLSFFNSFLILGAVEGEWMLHTALPSLPPTLITSASLSCYLTTFLCSYTFFVCKFLKGVKRRSLHY